ncbi:unnamed protein product [Adineta steineri]|uniref:Uncharacterized protein n=1 Tax=Adineta steineri TaxID=433720 RepID=A0A813UQK8_9BILA|nr:unnamed protein product [Adineta steineri]CAF4005333.1 unnamed protein product [Adineta steineri]
MKLFLIIIIIFLNLNNIELKCNQAWNGGGTGAWYRVDTSCEYSFLSTQLIYCLPTIILPSNLTSFSDGFYVSLGIFNRYNGVSLDIGLTFDYEKNKWFSYGNDRLGWKSGSISIDTKEINCINVSLSIIDDYIKYIIRTENGSIILGEDIYVSSQIDPLLNLTKNSSNNFGFYRFDSIAQNKETLKSGSQMIHAQMTHWLFQLHSGEIVPAQQSNIALNVSGYSPGPCCTHDEINTINVYQQIKWNQSDISINYLKFNKNTSDN